MHLIGFAFTFGILQDYFDEHNLLSDAPNIPTVSTTQVVCVSLLFSTNP